MSDTSDPEADRRRVLEETFGCAPFLEVPSRDEWERFDANLEPL